jgi:cell shape-determining protein MreC
MIYHQKNKNKRYRKYIILSIFLIALFFFGNFFKNTIQSIASPILNINSGIFSGIENLSSYFKSKNDLQKINKELFNQNQDFKIQIITLENLKKENDFLKTQLNFINPSMKTVIVKSHFILTHQK